MTMTPSLLLRLAVLCGLMGSVSLEADACGLCSPEFVKKVTVNIVYPGALSVEGAVWQAQKAGHLAMPDIERLQTSGEERALLDLTVFRKTVGALKTFGTLMGDGSPLDGRKATLLLVDEMMWNRFAREDGEIRLQADAIEPEAGELVIVTETVVLNAIGDASLTLNEAIEMKVLRVYGADDEVAKFLAHCGHRKVDPAKSHEIVTRIGGKWSRARLLLRKPVSSISVRENAAPVRPEIE